MGEGYSFREEVVGNRQRCRFSGDLTTFKLRTMQAAATTAFDQYKYHLTSIASRLHIKCPQNLGPHRSSSFYSHIVVNLTNWSLFRSCGRREWVAKCLGQITDTNRSEVQAELKQVISDAFAARTLWTTDWPAMQLQRFSNHTFTHSLALLLNPSYSLLPKPAPVFNNLKRKK